MDRERRDRRGASPSRAARAALLSRIAEQRAGKSAAVAIQSAHASLLPESDDSGSDEEEFSVPEARNSPGRARPQGNSSRPSSVKGDGLRGFLDTGPHASVLPESDDSGSGEEEFSVLEARNSAGRARPQGNSSRPSSVEQEGDGLGGVLDTLGGLSLGSSSRSTGGSNPSLLSVQNPSATGKASHNEHPGNDVSHRKHQGYHSMEPVELSSSDEEDSFQTKVATTEMAELQMNPARTSEQRQTNHQKFCVEGSNNDEGIKNLVEEDMILSDGSKKFILSGKTANKLYKHQQSGMRWLWGLHLKKMGGILGDDMGLGKTMQIAAFFAGLFQTKLIRTALVVAPKTLISHWVKELANVGLSRKTHSFVDTSSRVREHSLCKVLQMGGVLLTTYDMVRCNWKALRGDLHGRDGYGDTSEDIITWDYIVLDEGHLIKNPLTERAKSLRELPSTHRIIISGTPIQNNLKEMWALMDFCCPGLLGDKKEFKQNYESQIVAGNDKHASDRMKRLGAAVAQELREKLAPFFLRRMKSEVFPDEGENAEASKLSRKNDIIVWLQLTTRQAQLYRAFLESEAVVTALDTKNALTALSVLKKICDHPSLLTKRAADDIAEGMGGMMESEDRVEAEAMTASLAGLVAENSDFVHSNDGSASCKIIFVLILLKKLFEEGHRTLIFSQTRKMLNIIQEELQERGWDYCRIDGTLKSSEREVAVNDFQSNPDIPFFLLTSQVGGLGLTLTAADRVVIIDPAWNPSVDNQSVDRAYRIGQQKDVTVYRLMTCGTIEEKIYRKQVFKGGLMKIATETKNQMRYFSQQELHDLFRVPETGFSVSATQKQLAEEHFGEHRTSKELEEHIKYLEGLSMIAGVSHHDLLYSKAAPPLPPAEEDQDDTTVTWEPRNPAYHEKQFKPPSKVQESYTWDECNAAGSRLPATEEIFDEAKHAWLRASFYKDKIQRLAATLENEGMVSKLGDGGAKIVKKIKELNETMEGLKEKAAPYVHRNNGSFQPQSHDQGVDGRKALPAVVGSGEPFVRVRSSSGNNIYNTARVGVDVRKPQGPGHVVDSRVEDLEDVLSALRV